MNKTRDCIFSLFPRIYRYEVMPFYLKEYTNHIYSFNLPTIKTISGALSKTSQMHPLYIYLAGITS